jgi:hypothetical protein
MRPPRSVSAGASTTGGWRRPDGRWHGPGAAVGHAVNITSRSQTPATAWSDDPGEHRRWAGAGQPGVGREVLAPTLEDRRVAVNADHEAIAEHQLHFLEPDDLLGGHPGGRLHHREQQLPATSKAGRLAAVPSLSASARQLLGAGVAQAHQTKLWPGAAPGPVPRPLW